MFPEGVEGFFTTGLAVDRRLVWQKEHLARLAAHAAYFGVPFDYESLETEIMARIRNEKKKKARCRISYSCISKQWEVKLGPLPEEVFPVRCRIVTVKEPLGRWKTFPRPDFGLTAGEEAILVDTKSNRVYEGSYTNLFLVCADAIFTPPADGAILEGICRNKFLTMLRCFGHTVREEPFDVALLRRGRIFLTNALRGVMEGILEP